MSGSFSEYAAEISAGFEQGVEDISRDILQDIPNTYQEFLMADAGIRPPEGLIGDMVTTGPEAEPEISAPDNSSPEIDIE